MLAFILVALPLIIVAMPFVLTHHAWTERRRACPLCGERGSLEPVPTAQGTDPEDQEWSALRRRVNPENTVLKCRACGLHIRRVELEALTGAGRRKRGRYSGAMPAAPVPARHANHALGLGLLLVVTCIWGSTFAVVKDATASLHPATLIFWRFVIGAACILPLLLWRGGTPLLCRRSRADSGWTV